MGTFNAIHKAQTSQHRVFPQRVPGKAGMSRGRLSGCNTSGASGSQRCTGRVVADSQRGPYFKPPAFQGATNAPTFFPPRGHSFCRRKTPSFFSSLESDHLRLLGTPDGKRFHHRAGRPSDGNLPSPSRLFSSQQRALVHQELLDLACKGAIERTDLSAAVFVSSIFLVEKKSGQMRPVINLKALKNVVCYRHSKMEGIHLLRQTLL